MSYAQYYVNQAGGGLGDVGDIYHGPVIYQRGRGIGSFFTGLIKHLKPLFSSGLKAVKQQSLKSAKSVLDNIGEKPFKELITDEFHNAGNELIQRGINKIKKVQSGSGVQKMVIKRKSPNTLINLQPKLKRTRRNNKNKTKVAVKKNKKKTTLKQRQLDIFD